MNRIGKWKHADSSRERGKGKDQGGYVAAKRTAMYEPPIELYEVIAK